MARWGRVQHCLTRIRETAHGPPWSQVVQLMSWGRMFPQFGAVALSIQLGDIRSLVVSSVPAL